MNKDECEDIYEYEGEGEYEDELFKTLLKAHKKGSIDTVGLIANFIIGTTEIDGKHLVLDEKSRARFFYRIGVQFIADTFGYAELKDVLFVKGYATIDPKPFHAWARLLSNEKKQEMFLNSGMANEV